MNRHSPLVIKISKNNGVIDSENRMRMFGLLSDFLLKYYHSSCRERVGRFSWDNDFLLLYPDIVISTTNPLVNKIASDAEILFQKSGFANIAVSIVMDLFPYLKYSEMHSTERTVVFDVGYKSEDEQSLIVESFDESEILLYNTKSPTENTISLTIDRFDYIMDLLKTLDNGFNLFRTNIQVFCNAFVKFHNDKNYEHRKDETISLKYRWIDFAKKFSATEEDAERAYGDCENFSYSILTVEEILKDESSELKSIIEKYNDELFYNMVKNVLISKNIISHNDLHILFAEYIRKNHFFHAGTIYCFQYPVIVPVAPNSLSPLVNSFLAIVGSVKNKIYIEEKNPDESTVQLKDLVNSKYDRIVSLFSNGLRNNLIKDSCSSYINISKLTEGASLNKIVLKDYCYEYAIIDGVKTLTCRKSYMEDRFLGYINYDNIQNFDKTPHGKKAIENVYKTYKRMFKHKENVDFFLAWLGSIVTRNPERCILFMMGKDGENAKTSVINALCEVLGNNPKLGYAKTFRPDMFYSSSKGGTTCDPYWAAAQGALLASLPETGAKFAFSHTIMKEASGGDMKMAAGKFKDPVVFKHSAKLVIVGNDWVSFDNFDKALQSRMYPLICHGKFKQNISEVPESEEKQNELGIYLADPIFWKDHNHLKAQLWIMFNDGFEMYKNNGLVRTKYMEADLKEWLISTSNYVKFSQELEFFSPDGAVYITPVEHIRAAYVKKHNLYALTTEEFVTNFERETGICHVVDEAGRKCFEFRHKDAGNWMTKHKEEHHHQYSIVGSTIGLFT